MVFLDKRINGICDEMKKYAVRQRVPVEGIYYKEGNFLRPRDAEADGTPFAPFDSQRMHWYGPDRHYWFRAEITVPESFAGRSLWLHVRTRLTSGTTPRTRSSCSLSMTRSSRAWT